VKVEGPASHETKDTDSKGSVGRHLGLAAAHGKSKTTYDETKRKLKQKLAGVATPTPPPLTDSQQTFRSFTPEQRQSYGQTMGQMVKDRTAQARKAWDQQHKPQNPVGQNITNALKNVTQGLGQAATYFPPTVALGGLHSAYQRATTPQVPQSTAGRGDYVDSTALPQEVNAINSATRPPANHVDNMGSAVDAPLMAAGYAQNPFAATPAATEVAANASRLKRMVNSAGQYTAPVARYAPIAAPVVQTLSRGTSGDYSAGDQAIMSGMEAGGTAAAIAAARMATKAAPLLASRVGLAAMGPAGAAIGLGMLGADTHRIVNTEKGREEFAKSDLQHSLVNADRGVASRTAHGLGNMALGMLSGDAATGASGAARVFDDGTVAAGDRAKAISTNANDRMAAEYDKYKTYFAHQFRDLPPEYAAELAARAAQYDQNNYQASQSLGRPIRVGGGGATAPGDSYAANQATLAKLMGRSNVQQLLSDPYMGSYLDQTLRSGSIANPADYGFDNSAYTRTSQNAAR